MGFVIANSMWQFFFYNDNTNGCQHTFNNTGWKITGNGTCFCKTKCQLDEACNNNRYKESFISKVRYCYQNNRNKTAAGPETLTFELLKEPTTIPPITPV